MRSSLLALIASLIAAPLSAQNLLVNGGFETGDLTGWMRTFQGAESCANQYGVTSAAAFSGNFGFSYGVPTPGCVNDSRLYLTQEIPTIVGVQYVLSGMYAMLQGPFQDCYVGRTVGCGYGIEFGITALPVPLLSILGDDPWPTNDPRWLPTSAIGPSSFTRTFTATAPITTVRVGFWSERDIWQVDRLSVAVVPEPSTYAMMGAGLLALGAVLRRRREKGGAPWAGLTFLAGISTTTATTSGSSMLLLSTTNGPGILKRT